MSRLFASGGQSIRASASVLPMNSKGWFPFRLTGLISWQSKGLSRVFSNKTIWKHQFFGAQHSLWSNYHIRIRLLKKTIALTIEIFVSKVISLLFNMLSRFIIAFFPRSKWLLISWLQSPSARLFWWLRQWRICLRMQEVRVWSLGQGMATHCSILAWGRLWTEEPGKATVHGATKSQTWLSS